MTAVVDVHAGFAVGLLRALGPAAANVVVSPWSVSCALGVLAAGCDQRARGEIEAALGQATGPNGVVDALAADAARVAGRRHVDGDSVLAVANTLWIDDGRTPAPGFVGQLDRWPGAAVRSVPMAADPRGATRVINADVAATTRDLIPAILPDGISPTTSGR